MLIVNKVVGMGWPSIDQKIGAMEVKGVGCHNCMGKGYYHQHLP